MQGHDNYKSPTENVRGRQLHQDDVIAYILSELYMYTTINTPTQLYTHKQSTNLRAEGRGLFWTVTLRACKARLDHGRETIIAFEGGIQADTRPLFCQPGANLREPPAHTLYVVKDYHYQ